MSTKYGIREGQEIGVLFYRDEEFLGAVTIIPTTADQVGIQVHYYTAADLVTLTEAAASALGALRFESDKPTLRRMIAERIAELNALSEGGEESNPPPPPTADTGFLPF